ncbi:MAG: ABC-F family ATP-binding cassette domain-containing protein [Chitinophagaceae bacterium]
MLLEISNLGYHIGARTILDNINWTINPNEKIGIIGKNGAGKSTLLRLIYNDYSPSEGSINKRKDLSIAYFHQDLLSLNLEDSLLWVALPLLKEIKLLEKELHLLETNLNQTANPSEEKLLQYSYQLVHIEELRVNQKNKEIETQKVLLGLGFKKAQFENNISTFSGGWRMRAFLAQMILKNPDILMLDEPTNHLDLPTIKWLENYLVSYPKTVITVSHDQQFLNQIVNKIVEIELGKLTEYTGDYNDYHLQKTERMELRQKAYENQQQFIQQQERFIERFRAKSSKATQAQSAMKRLDKLEKIVLPETDNKTIHVRFDTEKESGKMVFEGNHLIKKYLDNIILQDAHAQILRGQKIALIGENGVGKSTLLRIVGEIDKNIEGKTTLGHNVTFAFYAQHQIEHLNLNNTVLEEVMQTSNTRTSQEVRTLLGCFLFGSDEVQKKVKVLSGGEKARLALVKVILMRANFLLLDEPTNHLDISSINILVNAIKQYQGTVLIVSHDRYFLRNISNTIWEIKDKKIKHFDGTYDEWDIFTERINISIEKNLAPPTIAVQEKPTTKFSFSEKKELDREFKNIGKKINLLEIEKKSLSSQLNNPNLYNDYKEFQKIELEFQSIEKELQALHKKYESIFEKISQKK